MAKKLGKYAFQFDKRLYVIGYGNAVGKKEGEGPLGARFDQVENDLYCGKKTLEQAEVHLHRVAMEYALQRACLRPEELSLASGGDLLNQCISSAFSRRESRVPYLGLYGACSTMALGTLVSALSVECGVSSHAAAFTGSHFGTAERQYRFPLEYGGQRPPAAQHTVTAAGAVILSERPSSVRLWGGAFGSILDAGICDANNMGGAMAPAAARLILHYLKETKTTPEDYDGIFTGDLGKVGASLLLELADSEGVDLRCCYRDCGMMIYRTEEQDMHAGGSGCGCSAAVLTAEVLPRIACGDWHNVLFLSTGALMSPLSVMQGESISAIAHLIHLKGDAE